MGEGNCHSLRNGRDLFAKDIAFFTAFTSKGLVSRLMVQRKTLTIQSDDAINFAK